ncbi:cysteine desulfurase family protein, partial [Aeromonas jandaei]
MIYFDNAASAIPFTSAVDFIPQYGNPSSNHKAGHYSHQMVNKTRQLLADIFGGDSENYYFTSGATESANLAIQGYCRFLKKVASARDEIIISSVEHPVVFNTVHEMEKQGFLVHVLSVNKAGMINIPELQSLISSKTALVCIMGVNNETGVIQPVNEAFRCVKAIDTGIVTICDAVQYLTKVNTVLDLDNIDCFFASGHKIGAAKGIGFLYLNERIMIVPLFLGGGQESGLRPGTENLYGIESLSRALEEHARKGSSYQNHVRLLKKHLLEGLEEAGINWQLNTLKAPTSDYVLSLAFPGLDAGQLANYLGKVRTS